MSEIEKIAENLFEKIRSRFEDVSLGDEKAEATSEPDKARFFNFDYVDSTGRNFGNVTVSIIDEGNLKVYFGKNISEGLTEEQQREWYAFLYDMRKFARRNLMVFDTRDVSRSNLQVKDLKHVSKSDKSYDISDVKQVAESRLYGTPKTSFENIGSARIRIVHTESVNPDVRGSRSRHINAIYVENSQGERFRMQHNKLSGARAMARHLGEGGQFHDSIGSEITRMVQEMHDLGVFVRGMRRRTFEDSTANSMLEAAVSYYHGMNRQLNHLKGPKAYRTFVENYQPQEQQQQLDEVDVNGIKDMFTRRIFDDRMSAALPYVYKAYKLQEQARTTQANRVKDIISGKADLELATNEGMDDYMKMLSFSDSDSMVVSVLEDIAQRAVTMPEIADFAAHWAKNWNSIKEDDGNIEQIKEHKALAVKLATQYVRDLGRLKENSALRTTMENDMIDFDRGPNILDEGTWALPNDDKSMSELVELLKEPLPVGVDGTNATSALYHLIGDDELFDRLSDLANAEGGESDSRDTIANFLKERMPGLYAKMGLGDTQELDAAPNPPVNPPAPTNTTGSPKPENPNLEGLDRMLRLAGMNHVLVK
jgi:hypothetical protein